MPLYTFKCVCGQRDLRFAKIAQRDDPQSCSCGQPMQRIIEAPFVRPEIPAYQSPIDGRWIDSRAQRQEDLKRNNCVEVEPGMKEDCERRRKADENSFFATVDASVDKTVAEMHSANLI